MKMSRIVLCLSMATAWALGVGCTQDSSEPSSTGSQTDEGTDTGSGNGTEQETVTQTETDTTSEPGSDTVTETQSETESVDPCESADCDENASCTVEDGDGVCACYEGYRGDGHACDPEAAWTLHVIGEQEKATYIFVADVDKDSDMDVVSASTEHMTTLVSEIALWRNDGTDWTKVVLDTDEVVVNNANGVVVGDIDADGRRDIVVAAGGESEGMTDKNGGGLYWYKAPDSQGGAWIKTPLAHQAAEKFWKVYVLDADQDDDLDIVAGGYASAVLFVNPGDDPETPASWAQVVLPAGTGVGINLANMDADPALEVLCANMDSQKVSWVDIAWDGDSFELTEHVVAQGVSGAFDIMAVDLSGDGRLDLVVTHIMTAGVSWYEAPVEATGEWIEHTVQADLRAADVFTGDIDGNGSVDFVLAGYDMGFSDQKDQIPWFSMVGEGANAVLEKSFVDYDGLVAPGDISLDDMDADGDLDVVTTSYLDGLVVWYENRLNELD